MYQRDPKPKAREIAIGTVGLLIGSLQLARAVDDPSLSRDILVAGTHVASTLIQSAQNRKYAVVGSANPPASGRRDDRGLITAQSPFARLQHTVAAREARCGRQLRFCQPACLSNS